MFDHIPVCTLDKPALRPLEIMPVRHQEQTLLMVRDPLGLLPGAAVLVPDPVLLLFLEMADGQTSVGEMAQRATMMSGQILPHGMFESIAQQLDEALLLQTERFVDALRKKHDEYMQSPVRPYRVFEAPNGDRLMMLKQLGEEMRRHRMSSLSPPERLDLPSASVCGILSPHIDYQRGGEAYAWAYQALKNHGTGAKTYIILGTSHRPSENRIVATTKNYDTPFGELETDTALLKELSDETGRDLCEEEYLHADEHTVELQATYLKHMYNDSPVRIVPILVGSIEDLMMDDGQPEQDDQLTGFTRALRTVLDRHGDNVALIGGVDLSHCGPQFGHEELNDEKREKEIEAGDLAAIDAIEKGDSNAFIDAFRGDGNARNVCSIAPIWIAMEAMRGRARARKLTYQQANSSDRTNLVSFASLAFVKEGVDAGEQRPKIILVKR